MVDQASSATTAPGTTGPVDHHPSRRRPSRTVVEWAIILVAALVAALLIRTYVVQQYYIPSASMEPTLMPGDRVLVDKLAYDFHSVHRGDIVVFARPPGVQIKVDDLIKRVIGLPGETIQSGPDGEVLINGRPIRQPWLTPQARADPGPPIRKQVVPKGDYFVMGDNRGDSEDSREIGPIPGKLIVGQAFVIVWPPSRWRFF